ncbi:hypothetical protein TrST_g8306 [Triparma strigata]|uniref:Uncharacterized protein n=1 Tax=Triparma strigata TaxID=1606541 RepID=A0A9W7C2Z5_9STRA|nr:hypothetical protein TrST_g8306 [Triparma strigata]
MLEDSFEILWDDNERESYAKKTVQKLVDNYVRWNRPKAVNPALSKLSRTIRRRDISAKDKDEGVWNIEIVYSNKVTTSVDAEICETPDCETPDCGHPACAMWRCKDETWKTCESCQVADFGGWPKSKEDVVNTVEVKGEDQEASSSAATPSVTSTSPMSERQQMKMIQTKTTGRNFADVPPRCYAVNAPVRGFFNYLGWYNGRIIGIPASASHVETQQFEVLWSDNETEQYSKSTIDRLIENYDRFVSEKKEAASAVAVPATTAARK